MSEIETIKQSQVVDNTMFSSQSQCSARTGVTKEVLRFAKKNGAPGFKGSSIVWKELKPWIVEHQQLIDEKSGDDLSTLKVVEKKLDIDLKRLERKKREGEYLDPKEVSDFLLQLRLSFESVIKGWATEIPSKLVGKSQGECEYVLNNEISILFTNFKEQINNQIKCFKK